MRYLKIFLSVGWLILVAFFYLKNHSLYYIDFIDYFKMDSWVRSGIFLRGWWFEIIGLWIVAAALELNLLTRFFKRPSFRLTPLRLAVFFIVMTWVTGMQIYIHMDPAVLSASQKIVFYSSSDFVVTDMGTRLDFEPFQGKKFQEGSFITDWSHVNWVPDMVDVTTRSNLLFGASLALTLLKVWGIFLFLLIFFHNIGALLLHQKGPNNPQGFQSIGIGMVVTMGLVFGLGICGFLTPWRVGGAIGLLFLVGLVKMPFLIRWFLSLKWEIPIKTLKTGTLWLVLCLMMILAFNHLNSFAAFPSGYDSMHVYHNTPQLLAQYHHLISGTMAYNYELLISLATIVLKSPAIGLQIVVLGAWLAIGLLYALLKKKFSTSTSLVLVSLFAGMPMIGFLMEEDLKIDIPLFFFSLLAISEAVAAYKNKFENKIQLARIGLWLGIAFGIKYTSLLLIGLIFAGFAYAAWGVWGALGITSVVLGIVASQDAFELLFLRSFSATINTIANLGFILAGLVTIGICSLKKKNLKTFLKPTALTAGALFLVFLPWLLWNAVHAQSLSPHALLYGEGEQMVLTHINSNETASCAPVYVDNEFDHYSGAFEGTSLLLPFVILWESTVTSDFVNITIADIGFIFLGFLVWGIFMFHVVKKENPDLKKIALFTLLYGLMWLFICRGLVWYGMPMFLGILWLYGELWKKTRWPYVVIGIWFLMTLYGRYTNLITHTQPLFYAGGLTNQEIYMEQSGPGTYEISAFLNSSENLDKNIYFIGVYTSYFIQHNDQRIYYDRYLDHFYCYLNEENPQTTVQRLRDNGFTYVLFSKEISLSEEDKNGPLHQRFNDFEIFATNFLEEVIYRDELILYRVPALTSVSE